MRKGLRQKDPLSPYLFLICVEGFSRLLQLAKTEVSIEGAKIGRKGPMLTHLFFAEDSTLFGKASQGITAMKKVINEYEQMSGPLVNFDKYLICFSNNLNEATKIQLREFWE